MSDDEMIRFWGEDSLVRWPLGLLARTGLSQEAKNFLIEVGLPRGADWTLRFDLAPHELQQAMDDPRWIVIGYDDMASIRLDLQGEGRAISFEPDGRVRFINSDVRRLAEFLVLYQQYRLAARNLGDDDTQTLISSTEQAMRASDPSALKDVESWWSVILEQMKAGLL